MRSRSCLSTSASTSSGSSPRRARRSLRATTSWRTSSRRPVVLGRGAALQIGHLRVDVQRRLAAGLAAVGLRLEHLADLLLGLGVGGRRLPAAGPGRMSGSSSVDIPVRPSPW